jgi:S-sulfo-L-cysteine synthase (O-acetyl-L-serine-dependent)
MVFSAADEGSDGAIRLCREIYWPIRTRISTPISTTIRPTGKRTSKAPARDHRADRRLLTHFVASMGTSGTFMGVTRRLRRDLPEVKCYSAQPSSGFHGLEGLKHMPTAIVPGIYDETLADGNIWIETEDAYRMVRRLAREEGLLVGISSGATCTPPP